MRPFEAFWADVPWLGVTLFQVTLLAALGTILWLAGRRLGPAFRGGILLASLIGVLLVPAISLVSPVWLPLPAEATAFTQPLPRTGAVAADNSAEWRDETPPDGAVLGDAPARLLAERTATRSLV